MSGVISRSDSKPRAAPASGSASPLAAVRVTGGTEAEFRAAHARTRVGRLFERGGYRLAFPSTFEAHVEALQINTGGGVAGGDRITTAYDLGPGADVVHTTSSAERIYRSDGAPAELSVRISLAPGARLDWLPQQTIVYAGARLARRIDIDVSAESRLLFAEMLTFGRPESRERARPARLHDRWRIARNGRLVFAEELRLEGEMSNLLARPAVGGGATASAIALLVAPEAADLVAPLRSTLGRSKSDVGVSAWNGLLVMRALARQPGELVECLASAIRTLSGRELPRVWKI